MVKTDRQGTPIGIQLFRRRIIDSCLQISLLKRSVGFFRLLVGRSINNLMKGVAPTKLVRIRTRWFLQKSRSSRAATVNLLHKMRDCPSILSPPLSLDCIYGRISAKHTLSFSVDCIYGRISSPVFRRLYLRKYISCQPALIYPCCPQIASIEIF